MDRDQLRKLAQSRKIASDQPDEPEAPAKTVKWLCEYCDKELNNEKVFMRHSCRERTRAMEMETPTGRQAYIHYSEWMRRSKRSVPPITTFTSSSFYLAFMKFAEYVQRVNLPNPSGFIQTMIKYNNVPPSLWCRDNVYAMYMQSYDAVVSPTQQYIESLDFILQYSADNAMEPREVFGSLGVDKLLELVQKRRLSPWFLVSSKAFRTYMAGCEQFDTDRLEGGIQVGAMIMRIQQNAANTELFSEFSKASLEVEL